MIKSISIEEYLTLDLPIPLADVRTPAEYTQGHIPGTFNLPIFSNEERVKVGTTYKQVGREEAILLGFDLTGPKWSGFIKEALMEAPHKKIAVHCWRGGMRSGAMAWALDLYGFEVLLIEGGYKSYRRWCLAQFERPYKLRILGGMTGSGKTRILQKMAKLGDQVIDLEDLAQHQGSSFGSMNRMVQPSQEQFENDLAYQLKKLNFVQPIWVEDESLNIGKRNIPRVFFNQMQSAPLLDLRIPLEQRIKFLVNEYGSLDKTFLEEGTLRIHKRLGPLQTKQAIEAIWDNRMEDFIRLVLVYYDKAYLKALAKRTEANLYTLEYNSNNIEEIIVLIQQQSEAFQNI
ncbi:tRNA 2-selenouridine(34) synthase MnmH [Dyadobacter tibetensis]|uniref:tRNA 2-selenouridine(34) synthase MnmH n=1 Tax=Dyadobacter tibetensis TaxID=1211851 RepID=UPI00046F1BA1|nr:tRNA 2-selenouridine(34) synthase MnmH [Dyadobacter tibetensis]